MAESELSYYEHSPLFPNPLSCLREIAVEGYKESYDRMPWNGARVWLSETFSWIYLSFQADWGILLLPVLVAAVITAMRMTAEACLLKRIPVWVKMDEVSAKKFPESAWKTLCYTLFWLWEIHIIFVAGDGEYFFNLRSHWEDWHPGLGIDPDIYWLYIVQVGLYYHLLYATIFLDTIRKDFAIMVLHHFVTLFLIFFSYTVRFHKVGLLVLFIHDIGDVSLEFTKGVLYFKIRNGKTHYWPEFFANILFVVFALQHILFRLYWLVTKVLYSTMAVCIKVHPGGPFYLFFNLLLITLLCMQLYWFKLIVDLIVKIMVHGDHVKDTREEKNSLDNEKTALKKD